MSNKNDDRTCDNCEEIWNLNSDEGFVCDTCYRGWCSEWCAEKDGYQIHERYSNCKYCRLEDVTDQQMIQWVLTTAKWTREQLVGFVLEDMRKNEALHTCT